MARKNITEAHYLRPNVIDFHRSMSVCGVCHGDMLSDDEIRRHIKDGLIQPVTYTKHNQEHLTYEYTAKGKKEVRLHLNIREQYKSNSVYHDAKVADVLEDRKPRGIARIDTEDMQREDIPKQLRKLKKEGRMDEYRYWKKLRDEKKISPCDMKITYNEGTVELIEITTIYYTREMKEHKLNYSKLMELDKPNYIKAGSNKC